jgi:hypothetical protein
MLFKLRCRKFIELILDAADALKRTQGGRPDGLPRRAPLAAPAEVAQISLANALAYGQQLELDYKDDTRPEIKTYLKRTFSVVAYEDPLNVDGEVGRIAGQESRNTLAMEMNQSILGMSRTWFRSLLSLTIENVAWCRGSGQANSTCPRIRLPTNERLSCTTWLDRRRECRVCRPCKGVLRAMTHDERWVECPSSSLLVCSVYALCGFINDLWLYVLEE